MRPYSQEPALADVNGCAGCLEMCLGHDMLTIDRELAPVQRWISHLLNYVSEIHEAEDRAGRGAVKKTHVSSAAAQRNSAFYLVK